ncbi:MAG: LptF/LptG family permease [Fimbriimonas sp.]|nr:LptF/LptG family permease [Fimbriimonas sp.]
MKQLDRLVVKELLGPWIFGVMLLSTLLMAATWLGRIADYIVQGLPADLIVKITLLLLPAIVVKTFAMAVLVAGLLGFGRLSSDSELIAVRAAGASLLRIMYPVMGFSIVIAIMTFICNDRMVPPAAAESKAIATNIANRAQGVAGQPVSEPIVQDGKLKGQIMAQAFDILSRTLSGVTVVVYNERHDATMFMYCNRLEYRGAKKWHIRGGSFVLFADGGKRMDFQEGWPEMIPEPNTTPEDLLTIDNGDNDIYSMAQIQEQIERGKKNRSLKPERIHNLEFGYWNKISIALATFIFGTLGAVLGIRNQRTGTASGFAIAIAIIFVYFMLTNFLNVWATNGLLPAWVASFMPVLIGAVATIVIMWRRNN